MIKYSLFSLLISTWVLVAQDNTKIVSADTSEQNTRILDIVTPIQDLQTIILAYLSWDHYVTINENRLPVDSPCGKFWICDGKQGKITLLDKETKTIRTLNLENPDSVAYSPCGKFIATHNTDKLLSGTRSHFLKIWNIMNGACIKKIFTPMVFFPSFTYSSSGTLIFIHDKDKLSAGNEPKVDIFDVLKGRLVSSLKLSKNLPAFDAESTEDFTALESSEGLAEVWYNKAKEIIAADAKFKKPKPKAKIEVVN